MRELVHRKSRIKLFRKAQDTERCRSLGVLDQALGEMHVQVWPALLTQSACSSFARGVHVIFILSKNLKNS